MRVTNGFVQRGKEPMTLFGSAGGGEVADGCAVILVFGALSTLVVVAVVGATRRSPSLVVLSFLLAVFVGVLVVPEAVRHELRDTDDSRRVDAMLWQFVWWWTASLCAPVGATVVLFVRGSNQHCEPSTAASLKRKPIPCRQCGGDRPAALGAYCERCQSRMKP